MVRSFPQEDPYKESYHKEPSYPDAVSRRNSMYVSKASTFLLRLNVPLVGVVETPSGVSFETVSEIAFQKYSRTRRT